MAMVVMLVGIGFFAALAGALADRFIDERATDIAKAEREVLDADRNCSPDSMRWPGSSRIFGPRSERAPTDSPAGRSRAVTEDFRTAQVSFRSRQGGSTARPRASDTAAGVGRASPRGPMRSEDACKPGGTPVRGENG